jgi:hypothetical protein
VGFHQSPDFCQVLTTKEGGPLARPGLFLAPNFRPEMECAVPWYMTMLLALLVIGGFWAAVGK